jgi:geranylgeranyl pyrophosphate synthase
VTTSIEERVRELLSDAGPLQPLVDHLASARGKMLRPLLVWRTCEACAFGSPEQPSSDDVLNVAAAFELVHMASLVHDDIIDNAAERRGMPTAHVIWGLHSAVLAGDYLFTRANKVALSCSGPGIASLLNQAIELTCEGEVAQDSRLYDSTVLERDYLSQVCRKTAALIGAACQAGAILGGAAR